MENNEISPAKLVKLICCQSKTVLGQSGSMKMSQLELQKVMLNDEFVYILDWTKHDKRIFTCSGLFILLICSHAFVCIG